MKYKISAKVESNTILKENVKIVFMDYEFNVNRDPNGIINQIAILVKMEDYKKYIPQLLPGNNRHHRINMYKNPNYDNMINLLQYIESLGAFWFDIIKIYWEEAKEEWIPESELESKEITIFNFEMKKFYPSTPIAFSKDRFIKILNNRIEDHYLVIPMSFKREGIREFRSFRYINAFFNFYFYLEGLYGGGKTKNYQVKNGFRKSKQIKDAINEMIANFKKENNKRHLNSLIKLLKEKNWELNWEKIVDLLVDMRGKLHHYTKESSKKQGHPLNHADYETIAFVLMNICTKSYVSIVADGEPK